MNQPEQQFFVTCPKSIEALLQTEIESLGGRSTKQTVAGVYFNGTLETAYRICLWSRLANRLLLSLERAELNNADDLYQCARLIDWSQWFSEDKSLVIDFQGTSDLIRHTRFGAQRTKDAIVDHFVNSGKPRPNVDFDNPDVRINAYLSGQTLTISLDLSGDSLHRRGYRQEGVTAPLKENLAAALLLRAGWDSTDYQYLIDPMCGSGTLVIEAALMKADIAPGLFRDKFGFEAFHFHQTELWEQIKAEAADRKNKGLENPLPEMAGFDKSATAISVARNNAAKVGLSYHLMFRQQALTQLKSVVTDSEKGLIITNPPYGKRLEDKSELPSLFRLFGERLAENYKNCNVAILLEDPELGFHLGYRLKHQYRFYNGSIACRLLTFKINDEYKIKNPGKPKYSQRLPEEIEPFVNRLFKNKKSLAGWLKQRDISCYRIYDADIPEFSAAIDIYGDCAHIQEYAPPASVKPELARKRMDLMVLAVGKTLEIDPDKIFLKRREKQRGKDQYQALDSSIPDLVVSEGAAQLYVNLGAYLDTGLFLDHRPIRQHFYKNAKNKRFLNLFCYTGSASVQAALAGAKTTNIDLSSTYINWAKRNFELNKLPLKDHVFYSEDILANLPEQKSQYDIIFLDPPTFSNSKSMKSAFDLQRDHVELIKNCMSLLVENGELYFSNNFRKFKLDNHLAEKYVFEDLTKWSIPRDFSRRKIHHCWKIIKK